MGRILFKSEVAFRVHELILEAPDVARQARPGQSVMVMADERGERIPLTIADFNAQAGTITLVLLVVGTSSRKLARLEVGESLYALLGPLGKASEIEDVGTAVLVGGGVGAAAVYPIASAFYGLG